MAKATNFSDFSWPEAGRMSAKNTELQRPFMQCTLPVENILWMEPICPITIKRAGALVGTEENAERPEKELHRSLGAILTKAERRIYYFVTNVTRNVGVLENEDPVLLPTKRYDCKRETYLY